MQTNREVLMDYLTALDEIIQEQIERCERYRALYERSVKTTTQLTGMPGGSGTDRDALLASVSDAETGIKSAQEIIEACKKKIVSALYEPTLTSTDTSILLARHLHHKKWKEIIAQYNISERQVYRIYKTAFDKCARFFANGMSEN